MPQKTPILVIILIFLLPPLCIYMYSFLITIHILYIYVLVFFVTIVLLRALYLNKIIIANFISLYLVNLSIYWQPLTVICLPTLITIFILSDPYVVYELTYWARNLWTL